MRGEGVLCRKWTPALKNFSQSGTPHLADYSCVLFDFLNFSSSEGVASGIEAFENFFITRSKVPKAWGVFSANRTKWERVFATLVDKAKIAEEVKRTECQNRDRERGRNKRDSEPSSFVLKPKKKARVDVPMRVVAPIGATGQPLCTDCGRHYQSECWKRTGACLRCGSLEHHIRECPRRSDQMQGSGSNTRAPGRGAGHIEASQPALVYAAYRPVDGDASDVITDIGSTHSYIACTVSKNLGILVERTTSEVTVLSPLGQSIKLVKHRVSLDCASKKVVLRTAKDNEVVIIGERWNHLSNVISVLRTEKLVRKGCKAYLAYISVSDSGDTSFKDIRTVKEFPDVFPKEQPGLPPNRKVEFGIELLAGRALMSIAPYRMAPKEFMELKA
ncbi:uncharacterized protein LOC128032055 [Gossypium raimondii]|uniref:uncharacterized protein LOC128032055 n=1 Tax=Gossypium raimondii TaxID=29730 RepID=UPI002279F4BA|nr:uncharacterized protein LOC128032055 [Gossypium raimondii]